MDENNSNRCPDSETLLPRLAKMTFAEILKSERERIGLTGADTAAALEVPARTYWDWERGLTTPPAVAQEGSIARLARMKRKVK